MFKLIFKNLKKKMIGMNSKEIEIDNGDRKNYIIFFFLGFYFFFRNFESLSFNFLIFSFFIFFELFLIKKSYSTLIKIKL